MYRGFFFLRTFFLNRTGELLGFIQGFEGERASKERQTMVAKLTRNKGAGDYSKVVKQRRL